MKDLVKQFLSEADKAKIVESVKKAEGASSGEIVPMIVSSSGIYSLPGVVGALAMSIPLSIAGTYLLGPLLHMGMKDLWLFLGIETLLFVTWYLLVTHVMWMKRLLIPLAEIEEEVRRAALLAFYMNGLHRTRDETGVLIYISIFERKVWVLGDRGINQKVGQNAWNELVAIITEGIRNRRQGDAICRAVERAGEILRAYFPIRPGDRDELPNIIIGE
jgi:putative membrane protein